VTPTVPAIYSPRFPSASISLWGRLLALSIGALALATLITAAMLPPSKDGVGTHQSMGLQSCQFLQRTGLPCPSCGMTTSFAWFTRGNLFASLYVQPMGTVLAIATAMAVWVGFYIGLTGRAVQRVFRDTRGMPWVIGLMCFTIVAWAWKIWIHLHGIDGW
jgi:hypothetical protein